MCWQVVVPLREESSAIPAPRTPVEPAARPFPELSARDLELLRHLAEGRSTSQIASAMSVTSNTARTRIRRVQRRLALSGREQVVEAARELRVG
jgi:DNA-binding CsgD family transcriptional regulator